MAYNLRWIVQFKSLANRGCLVCIYQKGYTGSGITSWTKTGADVPVTVPNGVTALTGAANSFEFQETEVTDMLQFIRTKTGYLRVIETTAGELDALYPASTQAHYVEVFYGTNKVFTGFMQCAEFAQGWEACPRVLEFAVVSPLGLLSSFDFAAPMTEPSTYTMGTYMAEVMKTICPSLDGTDGSRYTYVYYPKGNTYPWSGVMQSSVLCHLNRSFTHYDTAENLYAPKSMDYFITGICANYGWICHDTPDGLMFSDFSSATQYTYARMMVTDLPTAAYCGTFTTPSVLAGLGTIVNNADNAATKTVTRPLKAISIKFDGSESPTAELTNDYSVKASDFITVGDVGSNDYYKFLKLKQLGPDVTGAHLSDNPTLNSQTKFTDGGLYTCLWGKYHYNPSGTKEYSVTMRPGWYYQHKDAFATNGELILKLTSYDCPTINSDFTYILRLKIARGTTLYNLKNSGFSSFPLLLSIKVGDYYLGLNGDSQPTRSTNIIYNAITINGDGTVTPNSALPNVTNYTDVDGIVFPMFGSGYPRIGNIEIGLHYSTANSHLINGDIIQISQITLEPAESGFQPYFSAYNVKMQKTLKGSANGIDTGEVTVNFSDQIDCGGTNAFRPQPNGDSGVANPSFSYMFQPMSFISQRVKPTSTFFSNMQFNTFYFPKYRENVNNPPNWRIIGVGMNLWDDIIYMIRATSTTI